MKRIFISYKLIYTLPILLIVINCTQQQPEKGRFKLYLEFFNFQSILYPKKIPNGATFYSEKIDTLGIGDINFDTILDTAFVRSPGYYILENKRTSFFRAQNNNFKHTITFSNGFPEITIQSALWSKVENIGDINKDGSDELLIISTGYKSIFYEITLFSLKNKKWKTVKSYIYPIKKADDFKRIVFKRNDTFFLRSIYFIRGNMHYGLYKINSDLTIDYGLNELDLF